MIKRLLVVLALGLVLIGCTDPVKVEKANAIRQESEARYLATATAVAIQEEYASVAISATATAVADEEEVRAETQGERIERQEAFIKWSGRVVVAWILIVLVAFCIFSIGGSVAASRKANLEARLVRIDKTTRTWPILLDTKTGLLVDLETGERARLEDARQIDPGRLIISGQVRTTGLLAQSAETIEVHGGRSAWGYAASYWAERTTAR